MGIAKPPFVTRVVLPAAVLAGAVLAASESGPVRALGVWTAGAALWTLIEYALHRFVFHAEARSPRAAAIVAGTHGEHHRAPDRPDTLWVRSRYSLSISGILLVGLAGLTGLPAAAGTMSGIWAGFLLYERTHSGIHLTPDRAHPGTRERHRAHHRQPERNFGVTTGFWDRIFGTSSS